jgi:nanoRNase/pAp phosphatase (c-di-AMP/oligoRNAs hydrolase)
MPLVAAGGVDPLQVDAAAATVRQNPLVVAVALVGVVALVVVLRWIYGRARKSTGQKLADQLAKVDEVSVLMHPNPDPDAMASALAMAELAETVDTDSQVQYPGQIRHHENRAFEAVLDLDFDRVETASDLGTDTVVLVDHNEPRGFAGSDNIQPYAVVDHHPGEGTGTAFTDVRDDYGSCATIFAEYFEEMDWEPVAPDDDADPDADTERLPADVATGMVHGIQTDTNSLTKGCSSAEFAASSYLYEGIDEEVLDRIANPQVDAEVLEIKAKAIENREVRNAFAVSDVGEVSNVDAIPQAADELERLEGVSAVVVLGRKDGSLHLSGRSRDDRVHMGKTLRAVVEDIPMGNAGGHARMGGGQLSIEHMEGIGPSKGVTIGEFTDRLFDAMAGDY